MTRVAFIGVGTMGLPIARNLLAAGHELVPCDVDPTRAAALGVEIAHTAREAAGTADVVILSLPSPAAVEDVVLGPSGVRAGARPGTLLIDMSTSPPVLARRLAAELGAAGIDVLDAPVSGGPRGAEEGTLTVMVGGDEDAYARAEPLLRAVGRHVVRVGGHGAGQAAKLCNNLIAGATMVAIAEACAVAEQEGLDAAAFYELVTMSTGDSRVLRTRYPLPGADPSHPASSDYGPLFALDLIAKDLELVRALAVEHEIVPAIAAAALADYHAAQAAGLGSLDYSAVFLTKRKGE
jgi:3-hydroxyisobutyrate dehydrogenase